VGGLTVDCNTRTHEGALQSEAPFSAQRWYASGAVFMQLGKSDAGTRRRKEGKYAAGCRLFQRVAEKPNAKKDSLFRFVGCLIATTGPDSASGLTEKRAVRCEPGG